MWIGLQPDKIIVGINPDLQCPRNESRPAVVGSGRHTAFNRPVFGVWLQPDWSA